MNFKATLSAMTLSILSYQSFCAESEPTFEDTVKSELTPKGEQSFQDAMKSELTSKGQVSTMSRLPIKSIQFVYTEDGESYAVSGDARFVFIGKIVDLWQQKELKTIADAINTKRVPLEKVGYDKNKLAVWDIGNKSIPVQGTIFVSHDCPYCKKLLKEIDDNLDDYHFEIVLTPNGTSDENLADETRRLWCAADKDLAWKDLVNGTNDADEEVDGCDWKPVVNAGMFFQAIEGRGVPTIFRADGLRKDGINPKQDIDDQLETFLSIQ